MITYMHKPVALKLETTSVYAEQFVTPKWRVILNALLVGKKISPRDAAFDHEIFCLASVVSYLRHRRQIPVKVEYCYTGYGQKIIRYGEYYLDPTDIAEILAKTAIQ